MTAQSAAVESETFQNRQLLRRLADAVLRARAGRPDLHHRGSTLFENKAPSANIPMHLRPSEDLNLSSWRGIADALAQRYLVTDLDLLVEQRPDQPLAEDLFDTLEQLRAESQVPKNMPGVRKNIRNRFNRWTDDFFGSDLADSEFGILIFAVVVTARSLIMREPLAERMQDFIEATRVADIASVGPQVVQLARLRHNQYEFGEVAREIALRVAGTVEENLEEAPVYVSARLPGQPRFSFLETAETTSRTVLVTGRSGLLAESALSPYYRIFSTNADREINIERLCRLEKRRSFRGQVDKERARQRLSPRGLARKIQRRLEMPTVENLEAGKDEGLIDRSRLATLITAKTSDGLFQDMVRDYRVEVSVTVLLDCSGSMREHSISTVTAVDVFASACHALDIPVEVLGFTTRSWNGGATKRLWNRNGSPHEPGRLAERDHLVIKSFETDYRRSRLAFAALLKEDLYREALAGEAVDWACARAMQVESARRVVIVISDGAPAESATLEANGPNYLNHHLVQIVNKWSHGKEVEVSAIGYGPDMSWFYNQYYPVNTDYEISPQIIEGILAHLSV